MCKACIDYSTWLNAYLVLAGYLPGAHIGAANSDKTGAVLIEVQIKDLYKVWRSWWL
jgi:hypothetical protein